MTLNRTARSASQSRSVYHAFINKRIAPCGFVALGHSLVSRAFPASFYDKKKVIIIISILLCLAGRKFFFLSDLPGNITSIPSGWRPSLLHRPSKPVPRSSRYTLSLSSILFHHILKLSFAKWFPYCHTQNCRFQRVCACSYHQHLWEPKNFQFGSTTRIIFWLRSQSRRKRGTFTNENEIENNSYILVLLFSFEQSIWHNDRDRD